MDTEQSVAGLIQKAYNKLKASDAVGAAVLLEKALEIDFDNEETKYALKSVNWWIEHIMRIEEIENSYERGSFILSRLKQYYCFLDGLAGYYDSCQYAIRRFVFSSALICFQNLLGDGVNQHDPGLLLQVGRCFKGTGNYDEALRYLEQAARFRREDGETLAELADVCALLGEVPRAKALFREAFFLNPEKIDLRAMESEMIIRLRDKLAREKGYQDEELREWIPVYGKLWGVFSVIRELKPIEEGRLKQSIFSLKTEYRNNPGKSAILKPKLINQYLWLLDHYASKRQDEFAANINMEIKAADPEFFERYIK